MASIALDERNTMVTMGLNFSDWAPVVFGVPHSSILLPLLYIQHTADVT